MAKAKSKTKKKGKSPTSRSLERLRKMGYLAEVVEKRLPRQFITRDLFGCIDVLAVHPGTTGCLGVQATSSSHQAARLTKSLAEPKLRTWLLAGNRFEIWGWALYGAAGERKLWDVRRREVTLADLPKETDDSVCGGEAGGAAVAVPEGPGDAPSAG